MIQSRIIDQIQQKSKFKRPKFVSQPFQLTSEEEINMLKTIIDESGQDTTSKHGKELLKIVDMESSNYGINELTLDERKSR